MAKSYGVAGVVASFLNRGVSLRARRLSSDEAELVAQYRALTENDQARDALSDWGDEKCVAVLKRR
jgi:hypothetical protein